MTPRASGSRSGNGLHGKSGQVHECPTLTAVPASGASISKTATTREHAGLTLPVLLPVRSPPISKVPPGTVLRQPAIGTLKRHLNAEDRGERAAKRQACFGSFQPRASVGELTILEANSVLPATRLDYQKRKAAFQEFASSLRLPLRTAEEADIAMVEYLDLLFLEGATIEEGQKALAAWQWLNPMYPRGAGQHLVRSKKALQGWKKLAPAVTLPPLPLIWMALIIEALCLLGFPPMGAALALMFFPYLRPGEAFKLKERDLVPPALAGQKWALNLHPSDRHEKSKIQLPDEAFALDSRDALWLGPLLAMLRTRQPDAPLFKCGYHEFKKSFEKAQAMIGFQVVRYVLYQARHGGPSHDRREQFQTMMEVKQRGRWQTEDSLRRYEAHARLQQEELKESEAMRRRGRAAAASMGGWMRAGIARPTSVSGHVSRGVSSSSSSRAPGGSLVPSLRKA